MTDQDFVDAIRKTVVVENARHYERLLRSKPDEIADRDVHAAVCAFATMSPTDQRAMSVFVRQVLVDTVSNILGILDGSTLLGDHRGRFSLAYGQDPRPLNGELQELFLAEE